MNAMSAGDTILSGGSGMIGLSAQVVTERAAGRRGSAIASMRRAMAAAAGTFVICMPAARETAGSVVTPYLRQILSRFDAAPAPARAQRHDFPAHRAADDGSHRPARDDGARIYRTAANAAYAPGNFKLAATISDNVTTSWNDTVPDSSLTGALPASNTTGAEPNAAIGRSPSGRRRSRRARCIARRRIWRR